MKYSLIITLFFKLIFHVSLISQNGHIDSTYVWTEAYWNSFSYDTHSIKYTFDPLPSIINNIEYFEILKTSDFDSENWDGTNDFVRTQGHQVYLYRNGYDEEKLLYDFDASIGNTYFTLHDNEIRVTNIDTLILENGESRRRFKMVCAWDEKLNYYWIEGIGSSLGFLGTSACQFDWYSSLLCVYKDKNLLYSNVEFDSCWVLISGNEVIPSSPVNLYPNPVAETIYISDEDQLINQIYIFDINGILPFSGSQNQINASHFIPGIYIIRLELKNGKSIYRRFIKI